MLNWSYQSSLKGIEILKVTKSLNGIPLCTFFYETFPAYKHPTEKCLHTNEEKYKKNRELMNCKKKIEETVSAVEKAQWHAEPHRSTHIQKKFLKDGVYFDNITINLHFPISIAERDCF